MADHSKDDTSASYSSKDKDGSQDDDILADMFTVAAESVEEKGEAKAEDGSDEEEEED